MTDLPPPRDIVVLNESSTFETAGDVSLFRTHQNAISYVESIDVENNEYVALSGDGRLLRLSVASGIVHISYANDGIDYSKTLKTWLQHTAAHIANAHAARRWRGKALAPHAPDNDASIEELMRFIGFD